MNKSESIKELSSALAKFQGEVSNPSNTATNPYFKSKYAPLSEVINVTRPILSKNGLSVVQAPSTDGDSVTMTTILMHESGEWIESPALTLKMDKVTAQGAGSAITYARRYAISAILGISSEDDDDGNHVEQGDGDKKETKPTTVDKNDSKPEKPLSEAQIKRLYILGKTAGYDENTVNSQIKVRLNKKAEELTKSEYDAICKGYEGLKK